MEKSDNPNSADTHRNPPKGNKKKDKFKKPGLRAAAMAAAAILIAVGAYVDFVPASIDKSSGERILFVLGLLTLISLFIERGLEFFVELWRGLEKGQRETDIANRRDEIARQDKTLGQDRSRELKERYDDLYEKEKELQEYTAITHRISLWASFLFGLLISIAGVRTLAWILDIGTIADENQKILFRCVDVIFTACLISGGSEGLHKIMSAYNEFFDTSKSRSQDRRSREHKS